MAERRILKQSFAPVLGFQRQVPNTLLDIRACSDCRNMRFVDGVAETAPGEVTFGNNLPLLGTSVMLIHQYTEDDGSDHLLAYTTKYVYRYFTDTWHVDMGDIINDAESNWTATSNVTSALDAVDFKRDSNSVKLTIDAAFTTGLAASFNFTALDVTADTYLHFWVKSDIATAAGDIQLGISEQNTGAEGATWARYNIPALTAGTWKEVEIDLGAPDNSDGGSYPGDLNALLSVYLFVAVDKGAQIVRLDDIRAILRFTGDEDNIWDASFEDNELISTNFSDKIIRKVQDAVHIVLVGATDYRAKLTRSFKERLNLYHTRESAVDFPRRVRWARKIRTNATTDWDGTDLSGFVDIADARSIIVAAELFGDNQVVIFHEDEISIQEHLGGAGVYGFTTPVHRVGLSAQRAVINLGDELIFLSFDDVLSYRGGKQIDSVAEAVRREIFRTIDSANIGRSFMIYVEETREIELYVPVDNAIPDTVWRYHIDDKSWAFGKRDGTGFGLYQTTGSLTIGELTGTIGNLNFKFGDRVLGTTSPITLIGQSDGNIFKHDATGVNVNGAAQDIRWDSKDIVAHNTVDLATGEIVDYTRVFKEWSEVTFEATGTEVAIYYSIDFGLTWVLIDTITLSSSFDTYTRHFSTISRAIRIRFRENTVDKAFDMRFWEIGFYPRGRLAA